MMQPFSYYYHLFILIHVLCFSAALTTSSQGGQHRRLRWPMTAFSSVQGTTVLMENDISNEKRRQLLRELEENNSIPEGAANTGSSPSSTSTSISSSPLKKITSFILVVIVILLVILVLLIIRRKQELDRWHAYRTHQLLQAQEEAFELSDDDDDDETFDLELVESETSVATD